MQKNIVPFILLGFLGVLSIWSGIRPFDGQVWVTEMITALLVIVPLCCFYKKFQFSNMGYLIAFSWCVLQIIGDHYSFERVPFSIITQFFDFERNHYDRLAHFTIGVSSFLIAEFVWRQKLVSSVRIAGIFGIVMIMAVANFGS